VCCGISRPLQPSKKENLFGVERINVEIGIIPGGVWWSQGLEPIRPFRSEVFPPRGKDAKQVGREKEPTGGK